MKLLFLVAVFFISCNFVEGQKRSSCERKLKKEISKNWKYDSDKKGYISNEKFLMRLDSTYKECLHERDTSYISKLFGGSYTITQHGKNYTMTYKMISTSDKIFPTFYFTLNEKFQVIRNYFGTLRKGRTTS